METFLLQLGREIDLCREELRQVACLYGADAAPAPDPLAELHLDTTQITLKDFCGQLGGTVRAVRPLAEWTSDLEHLFLAQPLFLPTSAWAVSALSPGLKGERETLRNWIRKVISNFPDAHGREERPAPGDEELVPAKVFELRLDEKQSEVCLWRDVENRIWIGITEWVYSPEDYADRDMKKPHRPRRRGLLPPKLARQMINLARTPGAVRLLDPFCGSGVILLEALLLGFEAAGSDNRDEAIAQSIENLDWLLKAHPGQFAEKVIPPRRLDVRQLSTYLDPLSLDMVVGEGDLGPPIRGHLPRKTAFDYVKKLEPLYVSALAEIRTILAPGRRVCLAVPFWQPTEGDPAFLNLARRLALAGYQPAIPERGFEPILYRRKDQRVGRALYVLESPK